VSGFDNIYPYSMIEMHIGSFAERINGGGFILLFVWLLFVSTILFLAVQVLWWSFVFVFICMGEREHMCIVYFIVPSLVIE